MIDFYNARCSAGHEPRALSHFAVVMHVRTILMHEHRSVLIFIKVTVALIFNIKCPMMIRP